MQAFNAPYSMMMLEIDAVGMYDTAAEEMGKTFVTTELGGGGTTRASTVAIARRGVRNLLVHAGILKGRPGAGADPDARHAGQRLLHFQRAGRVDRALR
jgi:N-alpha-acetyl-L-2,4-diaminobutyrate deacetylase